MNNINKICDTLGELIIALKVTNPAMQDCKHKGTKNERLTELRKILDLTQSEMAQSLGVTQVAVQSAESGRSFLRIDNLQILVDLYNVNLNWLVSGEGSMFLNHKKSA